MWTIDVDPVVSDGIYYEQGFKPTYKATVSDSTLLSIGPVGIAGSGDWAFSVRGERGGTTTVRAEFGDGAGGTLSATGVVIVSGNGLQVRTTTTGTNLDPDGYRVLLDDSISQAVGINSSVSFFPLSRGTHTVELLGQAPNCIARGSNPRRFTYLPGDSGVSFEVECGVQTVRVGEILFQMESSPLWPGPTYNYYTVRADGSGLLRVTELLGYGATNGASWSPDGSKIALHSGGKLSEDNAGHVFSIGGNLFAMNSDGSNPQNLTNHASDGPSVTGYSWSPDGAAIVYTTNQAGGAYSAGIYTVQLNSPVITELTSGGAQPYSVPRWGHDGSRIAFSRGEDIYVTNADGSGLGLLTRGAGPSWSAESSRLAFDDFTGSDPGSRDAFVINVDRTGRLDLTTLPGYEAPAVWSPDGSRIAVAGDRLWVVQPDGTGLVTLYDQAALSPGWSSDGSRIAFVTNGDIYVAETSGRWVERVTHLKKVSFPSWRP